MGHLAFAEGVFLRGIVKVVEKMNNKPTAHAAVFAFLEIDKKHHLPLVGDRQKSKNGYAVNPMNQSSDYRKPGDLGGLFPGKNKDHPQREEEKQ